MIKNYGSICQKYWLQVESGIVVGLALTNSLENK